MPLSQTKKNGFSLVELLMVIVIISILALISVVAFTSQKERGYAAAAKAELGQLKRLVAHLESETSLSPGGIPIRPCISNTTIAMQDCAAGIQCNSGVFGSDWAGPYGEASNFYDPWKNDYFFKADYSCDEGSNNPEGCTGFEGTTIRVLASARQEPTALYNQILIQKMAWMMWC